MRPRRPSSATPSLLTGVPSVPVRTSAAQSYGDAVTLGAGTTITGAGITFSGTVDGAQTLSIVDSGATVFGAAVGGTTALASLTTDGAGTTSAKSVMLR